MTYICVKDLITDSSNVAFLPEHLPKPQMYYNQVNRLKQNSSYISTILQSSYKAFEDVCSMAAILSRHQCVKDCMQRAIILIHGSDQENLLHALPINRRMHRSQGSSKSIGKGCWLILIITILVLVKCTVIPSQQGRVLQNTLNSTQTQLENIHLWYTRT